MLHITDVLLCPYWHDINERDKCDELHHDDFCALCGWQLIGEKLYIEIHSPEKATEFNFMQPYVCMKCAEAFKNSQGKYLMDVRKEATGS